jgi:hypothetical protein
MTTKRTIDTPYGWLRVASTIETDTEALRIQAFAYEAGDHGDAAMQDLCYDALAGDEDALRRVRSAMVPAPRKQIRIRARLAGRTLEEHVVEIDVAVAVPEEAPEVARVVKRLRAAWRGDVEVREIA